MNRELLRAICLEIMLSVGIGNLEDEDSLLDFLALQTISRLGRSRAHSIIYLLRRFLSVFNRNQKIPVAFTIRAFLPDRTIHRQFRALIRETQLKWIKFFLSREVKTDWITGSKRIKYVGYHDTKKGGGLTRLQTLRLLEIFRPYDNLRLVTIFIVCILPAKVEVEVEVVGNPG